jgi:hypothetical protein
MDLVSSSSHSIYLFRKPTLTLPMQVVIPIKSNRLSILLLLVATILVGIYLWALHKGFDITDEGFYLLSYGYPAEYVFSTTSFHLLISKILPAQQVSIIGYRVASLVVALLSACAFSWGLRRWVVARLGGIIPWLWVLPLLIIGSMLQYAVSARPINYNGLNSLAVALFSSAVLHYLAAPNRAASTGLVGGGLAMGLDAFVKLSSSGVVLASGALVLILSLASPFQVKGVVRPLLLIGIGFLAGVWVFAQFILPLPVWYQGFRHETEILLKGIYNPGLLLRYVRDAYPVLRTLVYPFGIVVTLAGAWVYYQGRGINRLWQHLSILVAALALLVFEAYRTGLYKNTHLNYNRSSVWLLGPILVAGAMLLAARLRYSQQQFAVSGAGNWRFWLVPLWLLALPFAAALGTVNQIFNNAMLDAMYWMAVLVVLHQLLPPPVRYLRGARLALLMLPALAVAEQTAYGVLWAPYLQLENMFGQHTPLMVGAPLKPAQLLVDAPSAAFIQGIGTAMRGAGFHAGGPILSLYDAPGLVYALGGISPGNAWYPGFEHQDIRNCDALDKTHLDLHRAFLLVNQNPSPLITACLAEHGLHFPADYVLIHQVMNPFSRSRYNWHRYEDTMQVFAPRARMISSLPIAVP